MSLRRGPRAGVALLEPFGALHPPFGHPAPGGLALRIAGELSHALAIGGIPFVMWGIFLRITVGLHATWLVNSATHMWGSQRFLTHDDSKNSFWVAVLTFGEGWHNNHHAHPQSARHGLAWYEVDLNWYGIAVLKMLGLAWDVKLPKVQQTEPTHANVPNCRKRRSARRSSLLRSRRADWS